MCGIAGVVGASFHPGALQEMADGMVQRGPDGVGFYVSESDDVGFAFRRLAIVDPLGGAQPMRNEDGTVYLIFNGEIYDHGLLRTELETRGHRFTSDHSDTEVLVHGWEEWGDDLFGRLNGMFAIAIWEPRERRLVLARDRYGIKPLYFASLADGGLVFGSTIETIHRSRLVQRNPSLEGIREYFAFQNVWGERTMFEGVRQLAAGTLLTWRNGQSCRSQYWDISFPRSRRESVGTLAEEHREILRRVLRRQIAADVPVVSYLSGGIDSTAITVVSHEIDPCVTAYSCIFDLQGVESDHGVDEREYSRLVASAYGLNRVEHVLGPDVLASSLAPYVKALEDLRMGMGYPVFSIAGRVAEDARVVLSGTGGDEFHGGYVGRFQALGLANGLGPRARLRSLVRSIVRGRRPMSGSPEEVYRRMLNFLVTDGQQAEVFTRDFVRRTEGFDPGELTTGLLNDCPSSDWSDRVLYVDAKTYLAGLLALEDKLSMAHSLETRVPLLDNELVDFMLDVPHEALYEKGTGKVLFRESVRPLVPAAIYTKPKMGFGPPDASWYRGPLRNWIETTLSDRRIRARGVIRPEFVRSVLDDHFSGRSDATYMIWSLLNFDAWCEQFSFFE